MRAQVPDVQKLADPVVLRYPGPLYGLLRKLGFSPSHAEKEAEHERAHYRAAQAKGLNPKILLYFSAGEDASGVREFYLNLQVSFELPTLKQDTMRKAIGEIVLAPAEPSADDLAKMLIPEPKRGRSS